MTTRKNIEDFKRRANLPQLDNAFFVNMILIFVATKTAINITQNLKSCLQRYNILMKNPICP